MFAVATAKHNMSQAAVDFHHFIISGEETAATTRHSYLQKGIGLPEKLSAFRVALPSPGEAATADIMQLLPDEERDLLIEGNCPTDCPPSADELRRFPVFCSMVEDDYVPLLHRLEEAGMIPLFSDGAGVVENRIFGAHEDYGSWRTVMVDREWTSVQFFL